MHIPVDHVDLFQTFSYKILADGPTAINFFSIDMLTRLELVANHSIVQAVSSRVVQDQKFFTRMFCFLHHILAIFTGIFCFYTKLVSSIVFTPKFLHFYTTIFYTNIFYMNIFVYFTPNFLIYTIFCIRDNPASSIQLFPRSVN